MLKSLLKCECVLVPFLVAQATGIRERLFSGSNGAVTMFSSFNQFASRSYLFRSIYYERIHRNRIIYRCPCSPRHKHWPAGLAHFSDHRASSGQYIISFTGPYGPPRYMSGHQISNSGGPNDDKSQYVLFARAPVPHLGSFRAVLLLQRDASVTRVGVRHVNQTH